MRRFKSLKAQRGTAIFMALLVVSIATTLSIIWYAQLRISMRRTQQILISEQANLYADGVIAWAVAQLKSADITLPKILPATVIQNTAVVISGRIDKFPLVGQEGTSKQPTGTEMKKAMAQASQIAPQSQPMASAQGAPVSEGDQAAQPVPQQAPAVQSELFLLRSDVKMAEQYLVLYTLLSRKNVNNNLQIQIVAQSHGLD